MNLEGQEIQFSKVGYLSKAAGGICEPKHLQLSVPWLRRSFKAPESGFRVAGKDGVLDTGSTPGLQLCLG